MWSRRRAAAVLAALSLGLLAGPAWADHEPGHECDGDANIGGGGGEAGGECAGDGSSGGGSGGDEECDPDSLEVAWYGEPPESEIDAYIRTYIGMPPPEGMAWLAAYNCDGRYLGGPHLVPDPDPVDIPGLRNAARARVVPPLPAPRVSPSGAVVRFPTWLWVEDAWTARTATEVDGAVSVRVDATPVRVTWHLVDGTQVCTGPGIPWSEPAEREYQAQDETVRGTGNPACTFEFVNASSTQPDGVYHASVTVTWEFSWWLNGANQGVFGSVDRTTDFDVRVGEIQTVITR